jgi:hypothetical protein
MKKIRRITGRIGTKQDMRTNIPAISDDSNSTIP